MTEATTITREQNEKFVRFLTGSNSILIFTGAGISTNSGIPDYRGAKGVWKTRTPVFYQDFMHEEEKRHEYWLMKSEDWQSMKLAKPTPSHQAIVALQEAGKLEMCITQNIDGLHSAAGLLSEKLVEIHGSNSVAECMDCGDFEEADPLYSQYLVDGKIPACQTCGGLMKPGVISFGQNLRENDMIRAASSVPKCDLVLALGSTLQVQPAASFPIAAAREGIPYVIVNMGPTAHDGTPYVTLRLEGDLDEIFPAAVADALAMSG